MAHRAIRVGIVCVALAAAVVPACGVGWMDEDLWAAEMKLDELRDAVVDQVGRGSASRCV